MNSDKADVIARICAALAADRIAKAADIGRREYPFLPVQKCKRAYTPFQSMRIFLRDGFVDRYNGDRLVFPPRAASLGKPTAGGVPRPQELEDEREPHRALRPLSYD
jgi:hypothetical protein